MGLDMYLYAKRYEFGGHWDKTSEDARAYNKLSEGIQNLLGTSLSSTEGLEVSFTIMYWRKANAIHNWFVQECGGGKDECQDIYVEVEDLERLHQLCSEVAELFPEEYTSDFENEEDRPPLSDEVVTRASQLLPPISGFFFGGTGIDIWYYDDIVRTRDELSRILEWERGERNERDYSDWSFSYRASW